MCTSIINIIIYIFKILEITENTKKIKKSIHSHIIWGRISWISFHYFIHAW